jgi:secreted trypsin-like serine protease
VKPTGRGPDILVGVTSYGPEGCGHEENVGAYTSIPKLRSWIDSQIKALKV